MSNPWEYTKEQIENQIKFMDHYYSGIYDIDFEGTNHSRKHKDIFIRIQRERKALDKILAEIKND